MRLSFVLLSCGSWILPIGYGPAYFYNNLNWTVVELTLRTCLDPVVVDSAVQWSALWQVPHPDYVEITAWGECSLTRLVWNADHWLCYSNIKLWVQSLHVMDLVDKLLWLKCASNWTATQRKLLYSIRVNIFILLYWGIGMWKVSFTF